MTVPGQLDHAGIAARIPHAGTMCLLDGVVSWDENHIECTGSGCPGADDPPHPLADSGRLPATAAIEYAAQAMALHGSLMQEKHASSGSGQRQGHGRSLDKGQYQGQDRPQAPEPRRGFLAGLRSVRLHQRWIGQDFPTLTIRVERFAGDEVQVLYDFHVRADGIVAEGRAVVVLDAGARSGAAQ